MTRQAVMWFQKIFLHPLLNVDTPLFPPSLVGLPIPRSLLTFNIQTSITFWHQCSINMMSSFFRLQRLAGGGGGPHSTVSKFLFSQIPAFEQTWCWQPRATEDESCPRMLLYPRLLWREIDLFGTQRWRSSVEDSRAFHGAMRSGEWQSGWYTIWGPTSDPQISRANTGWAHCACVRAHAPRRCKGAALISWRDRGLSNTPPPPFPLPKPHAQLFTCTVEHMQPLPWWHCIEGTLGSSHKYTNLWTNTPGCQISFRPAGGSGTGRGGGKVENVKHG